MINWNDINLNKELDSKELTWNLAITFFQSGKFRKALPYIITTSQESLEKQDIEKYLTCYKILSQTLLELFEIEDLHLLQKEFEDNCQKLQIKKTNSVLISKISYLMNLNFISPDPTEKRKKEIFQLLTQALNQILEQEKEKSNNLIDNIKIKIDLIYCLEFFIRYHMKEHFDLEKVEKDLDNIKILVDYYMNLMDELLLSRSKTDNIEDQKQYHKLLSYMQDKLRFIQEVKMFAKIHEAWLAVTKENLKKAEKLLWESYEMANKIGSQISIPYILIQMSNAYRLSGDLEQAEAFCKLAEKNADPDRKLFIKQLETFKKETGLGSNTQTKSYDLIFNMEEHSLMEKQKGCVNFKNQFILLEMFKLFLLHPGESYSKKDIVEKIWKQEYCPSIHDNKIYVTIKRLREMVEPNIQKPKYICRNSNGYYLSKQVQVLLKGRKHD